VNFEKKTKIDHKKNLKLLFPDRILIALPCSIFIFLAILASLLKSFTAIKFHRFYWKMRNAKDV
jgi:hypothetical protein